MTKKRPMVLHGRTIKLKTGCGSLWLTMNFNDGKLFELRFSLGKSGHCISTMLVREGIALSKWLQTDPEKDDIIDFFKEYWIGVSCNNAEKLDDKRFSSCGDVIGRCIIDELEKDEAKEKEAPEAEAKA